MRIFQYIMFITRIAYVKYRVYSPEIGYIYLYIDELRNKSKQPQPNNDINSYLEHTCLPEDGFTVGYSRVARFGNFFSSLHIKMPSRSE